MKDKMKIHYSSESNEWATPQEFFDNLNKEFNFTLDPCATNENAKCKKFYTLKDDGLKQSWDNEIVFCNPPYGREIKKWVKKASEAVGGGSCFIDSCSNLHILLSRLYIQQSGGSLYSWSVKIWGCYYTSSISFNGGNF